MLGSGLNPRRFSKTAADPNGSHALHLSATRSYLRDIAVSAPLQTSTLGTSTASTLRLSTEGLVLRKSRESVNAFCRFFAEGEIGGTLCMRSHISV
jgi:hypothetical protein